MRMVRDLPVGDYKNPKKYRPMRPNGFGPMCRAFFKRTAMIEFLNRKAAHAAGF